VSVEALASRTWESSVKRTYASWGRRKSKKRCFHPSSPRLVERKECKDNSYEGKFSECGFHFNCICARFSCRGVVCLVKKCEFTAM
jgi:hypothetical protein